MGGCGVFLLMGCYGVWLGFGGNVVWWVWFSWVVVVVVEDVGYVWVGGGGGVECVVG